MADPLSDFDVDHGAIFLAVGLALTTWKKVELGFACLHSIFIGEPRLIKAYDAYGQQNGVFARRINAVEHAAERYFTGNPDQGREGTLRHLIKDATTLSVDRHRIAHGILMGVPTYDPASKDANEYVFPTIRYTLGAPWYSVSKLKTNLFGIGGSTAINASAEKFEKLASSLFNFANILSPEP